MKHRIVTDSQKHEFRTLRNRIESEIQAPALVFVTSATARDGAGLTAYGLAESLSHTRQRAVLLTTDMTVVAPDQSALAPGAPRRRASDRIDAAPHAAGEGRFSIVAISPERLATISRSSVDSMLSQLRSENDYVVVDAGDLPNNSFALLLLGSADTVLISFRRGRSQSPADRTMLDTLDRAESKILGVVMTDEEAIAQYELRDEAIAHDSAIAPKKPVAALAARVEVAIERLGKSN